MSCIFNILKRINRVLLLMVFTVTLYKVHNNFVIVVLHLYYVDYLYYFPFRHILRVIRMIFNIFYSCLLKKQLEKYRQGFLNILIISTFVVLKKEYLIILY